MMLDDDQPQTPFPFPPLQNLLILPAVLQVNDEARFARVVRRPVREHGVGPFAGGALDE